MLRPTAFLLIAASLAAGEERVTARRSLPVALSVADLSQVASARFFVSDDRGKTWKMVQQVQVDSKDRKPPVYSFVPPADGAYAFRTAVRFRNGSEEPAPVPGPVDPAEVIVVDLTPPTIEAFAVEVRQRAAGRIDCTVTWRMSDLHLNASPATIQLAEGDTWTDLATGLAPQGSTHLTVPPGSRMRLQARDRVGNTATGTPWTAPIVEPPTLPVLAEVKTPEPVATKTAASAPKTADPTVPPTERQAVSSPPAPPAKPAEPPLTELPEPWTIGLEVIPAPDLALEPARTLANTPSGILDAEEAMRALTAARQAVVQGEHPLALNLYRRCLNSRMSATAIVELLLLLRRNGQMSEAMQELRRLPPEAASERLAVLEARIRIQLNQYQEAEKALAGLAPSSPRLREGYFLNALVLHARKRDEEARQLLRHLAASGTDLWAQTATRMLTPPRSP